jgi:L-cysteine:1D-myo-inositol 2-amino-2-deoxy-alpha-D-glucopyranoside ligase
MNSWAQVAIPPLASKFSLPTLEIFDTAKQKLSSIVKKDKYRIYVCGITPYDATHLGHANTYLAFDLINRYLLATGSEVLFVQNITDIDDPLLERANRDGVDWRELATSQIDLFRSDMVALHVLPPKHYIGAVEAIPLVVEAISDLQKAIRSTKLITITTFGSAAIQNLENVRICRRLRCLRFLASAGETQIGSVKKIR